MSPLQKPLLGLSVALALILPTIASATDFDPSGRPTAGSASVATAQPTIEGRLESGNLRPYRVVDSQSPLDVWVKTLVNGHRTVGPSHAPDIDGIKSTQSVPESGIWSVLLFGFLTLGILTRCNRRDRQLIKMRDRRTQRLEHLGLD